LHAKNKEDIIPITDDLNKDICRVLIATNGLAGLGFDAKNINNVV